MADLPVIRIDPAWDDPEAVRALIESRGPYPSMTRFEKLDGLPGLPWFRERWAVDGRAHFPQAEHVLHNRHFVAAAERVSGARVVRPQSVIVNLMGPQPAGAPHVDTPSFRGLPRGRTPTGLLLVMGASGLFRRWSIPIASAIAWWYAGPEGDFEYWPHGPGGPVERESPPFGNAAIVGDNDTMFHRVGAIGKPADYLPQGAFGSGAELHLGRDGAAEVIEAGSVRWRWAPGQLRLSILWKAHAFAGERDAALYDERSDDLTRERVAEVFCADLARRGLPFREPVEPFDPQWLGVLARAYPLNGIES